MQGGNNKRNPAISLSRVLGMLFIVLCHIIKYYSFIPMHESLGQFFNCGVDLFLFISGYLYGGKIITDFKKWYFNRFLLVVLPAIFVSIITIIALLIAGEPLSVNSIIAYSLDLEGLMFLNWIFTLFFKEILSLGPLWFTTIIMICYLFVPVLQKISKKIRHYTRFVILLFLVGSVVSILFYTYCSTFYFVIFSVGYFSRKINLLDRINIKNFLIYTAVFVFFIVGRVLLQKTIDGTFFYLSYVTISHFFIGTWFVILFSFLYNKQHVAISMLAESKGLKILDSYSFFVYLTHGVFCMGRFNFYEIFSIPVASILFVISTTFFAIIVKYMSKLIGNSLLY